MPWLRNVPSLPLMPDCLLSPFADFTDKGGQKAQQFVFAFVVFLQMMWWVVSPWNVYRAYPAGPIATASWVLTALTLNALVGSLVTWTFFWTLSVNEVAD